MESQRDRVVVIGCGLSGLLIARNLSQQGVQVVILEASDRVGGRVLSENLSVPDSYPSTTTTIDLVFIPFLFFLFLHTTDPFYSFN